MRIRHYLFLFLLVMACGTGLYYASFAYFKAEEIENANGRLSLYRSTLISEIERIAYFPYVLSKDPHVINGARGFGHEQLSRRLEQFANRSDLDAIYLMDRTGETIASSNYDKTPSYLGQNYSFRPYFQQSLRGEHGEMYAIGVTTKIPGFFISTPVFNAAQEVIGVIAIKLDLGRLEQSWMDAGEQVVLANRDGIIMLSSDPNWRYRALSDIPNARMEEIKNVRQFGEQPLSRLKWKLDHTNQALVEGEKYLVAKEEIPNKGWSLYLFASEHVVQVRVWMLLVTLAVIGTSLFGADQLRRTMRIGRALRAEQADSADLREANQRLALEIEERKAAELGLQKAQNELARTSRLAALGQLSVSVTHELGQPIAAMKNYLIAAEISPNPPSGKFLGQITGLISRMENIAKQLKFFSSSSNSAESFEAVNLQDVVRGAEELLAPNLNKADVRYTNSVPHLPVVVHGNRLRLEQVLTNVMRNAVDAMQDEDQRTLHVDVLVKNGHGVISVADTGPGLGQSSMEDLQEPFYTTRASGEGMGLGLAISAEIVKEHGGRMHAGNRTEKGAVFVIEIPLEAEEENAGNNNAA